MKEHSASNSQEASQMEKLYVQVGQSKSLKTIPLAFTLSENISPVCYHGFALSWSLEAIAAFSKILADVKDVKNSPYASLRGWLEIALPNISRILANMGLTKAAMNRQKYDYNRKENHAFAYLKNDGNEDKEEILKTLQPILNDWLELEVIPYGEREKVSEEDLEKLRELQSKNSLLSIQSFKAQIFPWLQHKDSGTARPSGRYSFPALADYLARLLAGREVFRGLGGLKRIITGEFGSRVQLMTEPIQLDNKDLFSLLVDLEIITFPSFPKPLIKIEVSKRRWLSSIVDNKFAPHGINSYVFSREYEDRVFNFKLERRKNEDTKRWEWRPDTSLDIIQRTLGLPLGTFNTEQLIQGEVNTEDCQVVLTYRNGLQRKTHAIKAGVPEIDKLEAFSAIEKIFSAVGLVAFEEYKKIIFPRGKGHPSQNRSEIINTPTSLNEIFESLESEDIIDSDKTLLEQMSNNEINEVLKKYFDFKQSERGLEKIKFSSSAPNQSEKLQTLVNANREALDKLYPGKTPLLIIFHDPTAPKTVQLLVSVIKMLFGNTLIIKLQPLPDNTHGTKFKLNGSNLKNRERANLRVRAWRKIAEQIGEIEGPKFCLVMANDYYSYPDESAKSGPDDSVNKPSTRQALASIGRTCVQFILPPRIVRTSKDVHVDDFMFRAQAAIKDLLWAHSGRIDNISEKVAQWFGHLDSEDRPKEIISLSIVRKNAGRARGRLERTFLTVAIRTSVESGVSEMCCCHEDIKNKQAVTTEWKPFIEAISDVATIAPVTLGKDETTRKIRFQEFVEKVISTSVAEKKNPVVIIDSSNCVKLWNWLADKTLNFKDISIGSQRNMQDNWQGARIVRVRQDLSPGIVENKDKYLLESSEEDRRHKKNLKADTTERIKISAPSSPKALYRLNSFSKTGCVCYLSVGHNTVNKKQKGYSCYRETELDRKIPIQDDTKYLKNKGNEFLRQLKPQPPYTGQWATPNPLEIVVTLRQEQDEPDKIAGFIESLRYGYGHFNEWTSLPAPLFFERVVRDYISEFSREEDEEESEVEEDE